MTEKQTINSIAPSVWKPCCTGMWRISDMQMVTHSREGNFYLVNPEEERVAPIFFCPCCGTDLKTIETKRMVK